jgi:hypothetical protein
MATDCRPHRPRRRTPTLALACALALLTFAAPARAASAHPAQGLYDECAPALDPDGCAARLQTMGKAGFTLVLNYTVWSADAAQVRAYAAAAAAAGIKVIWPLNDVAWRDGADLRAHYPLLAAGCACTDDAGFERYVVGLVSGLPATWGYYAADEPTAADLPAVANLVTSVRALDPAHPTLVVGYGSPGAAGAGVDPFVPGVAVAGDDLYPIGADQPPAAVAPVSRAVSRLARRHHETAAVVLQAFSYDQYATSMPTMYARWPTATEMLAMRNAALTAGDPAMLLWYSYYDVMRSADPASHWRDLLRAAFAPWPAPATRARVSARPRSRRRVTAADRRRPTRPARRASSRPHSRRPGTPARP